MATIVVGDVTVTLVAAVVPKETVAVLVNPVPVIVTVVPPATGPVDGVIAVTVGAATETAGLTDPLGGSANVRVPGWPGLFTGLNPVTYVPHVGRGLRPEYH